MDSRPLIIAGLLLLLAGCAPNLPHRTYLPVTPDEQLTTNRPASLPPIDSVRSADIETNQGFNIGYVEFDDQGWFWSHKQWDAVKAEIGNESSNSPAGLTLVVFVHGWKNNADYDNTNVNTFRSVLAALSHDLSPRKVMGVYAGWRGATLTSDWFPPAGMELTIYNRKKVAERIGHAGAATQVFTELEMIQDEINHRPISPDTNLVGNSTNLIGNSTNRAELVIVGHSLGADLVYSATSQILTERLVAATRHEGRDRVRSLGDLIILLNPAFEASPYNNLISLATSTNLAYPPDQPPVLAIFRSRTDWATGWLFTSVMALGDLHESTRSSRAVIETDLFNVVKSPAKNERRAITHSIGYDDDYLNYDLLYTNVQLASVPMDQVLRDNSRVSTNVCMTPYIFPLPMNNCSCILQPSIKSSYVFKQRNPFLDVLVDPKIMDGHDDIANTNLLAFLRAFILSNHTNYLNQSTSEHTQSLQ